MLRFIFNIFFKLGKRFSRQNLYKWLKDRIRLVEGENLKILNIGAGGDIGNYINMLKVDNEVITIDISPESKPDIVMDAMQLDFKENSFDIVFMMEILEHIKEPEKAISEVFRVLKEDGYIVFSTPFVFGIHDAPYDFFRYTRYGLFELFKKFKTVDIKERNDYIHTIIVLCFRLLLSEYKLDKLIGMFFGLIILMLYPILYILSKLIKSKNITTGYFCIAKK